MSSKVENLFLKCEIIKIDKIVKYLNSETEFLTNNLKNKIKSEYFKIFFGIYKLCYHQKQE